MREEASVALEAWLVSLVENCKLLRRCPIFEKLQIDAVPVQGSLPLEQILSINRRLDRTAPSIGGGSAVDQHRTGFREALADSATVNKKAPSFRNDRALVFSIRRRGFSAAKTWLPRN